MFPYVVVRCTLHIVVRGCTQAAKVRLGVGEGGLLYFWVAFPHTFPQMSQSSRIRGKYSQKVLNYKHFVCNDISYFLSSPSKNGPHARVTADYQHNSSLLCQPMQHPQTILIYHTIQLRNCGGNSITVQVWTHDLRALASSTCNCDLTTTT